MVETVDAGRDEITRGDSIYRHPERLGDSSECEKSLSVDCIIQYNGLYDIVFAYQLLPVGVRIAIAATGEYYKLKMCSIRSLQNNEVTFPRKYCLLFIVLLSGQDRR